MRYRILLLFLILIVSLSSQARQNQGSPTISSFTPTSAVKGSTITIVGTNLTGATAVSFGEMPAASFTVVSATKITAVIDEGASGDVAITTRNGSARLGGFVFLRPPTVAGPTSAEVCQGAVAKLTATVSNGTNVTYQWQKKSGIGASLNGLRWEIPKASSISGCADRVVDPRDVTATMDGVPGTMYAVKLRIRGVVETKSYTGGTGSGFWNANGDPRNDTYNIYELNVSEPQGKYYLNAGSSGLCYSFKLDYEQTINIKAGATVTLKARTLDNFQIKNVDQSGNPIVVSGIAPSPAAYDGQFIQMDVTAINGSGFIDLVNGEGYAGTTTSTLDINTAGGFGAGEYRCKISSPGLADVFSDVAKVTIKPTPAPPTASAVTICQGKSAMLVASGGADGRYRWYADINGPAIANAFNESFVTPPLQASKTYYASIHDGTCESKRIPISITVNPVPQAPEASADPVCPSNPATIVASGGVNGQYQWFTDINGTEVIPYQVNNEYTTPELTTTSTFYVAINNGLCMSERTPVTVTVSTTACGNIEIDPGKSNTSQGSTATLDILSLIRTSNNNLDLRSIKIVGGPESGANASIDETHQLTVDYSGLDFIGIDKINIEACTQTKICASQEILIEVSGEIIVFNALSPNGDQQNEVFYLKNIDLIPDRKKNKVVIYNRWGDVVFTTENYDNDSRVFRGLDKNGNPLPSGSYFYRITFESGANEISGYISLRSSN